MACLCNLLKIMPVTEWTSYGLGFLCPELQKEASGLPSPRRGQSLTVCTEHDGHGPGGGWARTPQIIVYAWQTFVLYLYCEYTVNDNKGVQSVLLEV